MSGKMVRRERYNYVFVCVCIVLVILIFPLSVIVCPKVEFSVPYSYFCLHSHPHRSLTVTQFPTVNLQMIASCTLQCLVNIFLH